MIIIKNNNIDRAISKNILLMLGQNINQWSHIKLMHKEIDL